MDTEQRQPRTLGLEDKVVLVTGAAGGLGRATVELLVASGAKVLAVDHDPAVDTLAQANVITATADIRDERSATATVDRAVTHFGTLDALINNAGRTLNKPILDTTVADWEEVMSTNALGTFIYTRGALRAMVPRQAGAIVNVASMVSTVALPDLAAYAASKGAIAQLTKVTAVEHAQNGIRANAVAAGVIETDILRDIVPDSRASLRESASAHPLGRIAQPHEIAEVLLFAISPRASFMTGALIATDGGYTAL